MTSLRACLLNLLRSKRLATLLISVWVLPVRDAAAAAAGAAAAAAAGAATAAAATEATN